MFSLVFRILKIFKSLKILKIGNIRDIRNILRKPSSARSWARVPRGTGAGNNAETMVQFRAELGPETMQFRVSAFKAAEFRESHIWFTVII